MYAVKVDIVKIIDASTYPTIIEFELIDTNGKKHCFIDKLPIVSNSNNLELPQSGYMKCSVLLQKDQTFIIDTQLPNDIESTDGKFQFEVEASKITVV